MGVQNTVTTSFCIQLQGLLHPQLSHCCCSRDISHTYKQYAHTPPFYLSQVRPYMLRGTLLFSLNISWKLFHSSTQSSTLFFLKGVWRFSTWTYNDLFNQFLINRHLNYFQSFATVANPTVNILNDSSICVQVNLQHKRFISAIAKDICVSLIFKKLYVQFKIGEMSPYCSPKRLKNYPPTTRHEDVSFLTTGEGFSKMECTFYGKRSLETHCIQLETLGIGLVASPGWGWTMVTSENLPVPTRTRHSPSQLICGF